MTPAQQDAIRRAQSIGKNLNDLRRNIMEFRRDKCHVQLGYEDSTAGLRQCAKEWWGRSLSWFYRMAQEHEIRSLSPVCETLSGRALRELAKLETEVALAAIEVAQIANNGKLTESAIRHAADNIAGVLSSGAYADGEGGQVSVTDLQVAGTASAIAEAKARAIARLEKRTYLIPASHAVLQDAKITKGKLYLLVEVTPDDFPSPEQLKADGANVMFSMWRSESS